jgi:AcrR family transcriptional regulator
LAPDPGLTPPQPSRGRRTSAEPIIAAAERLFGRHGLDGVSLRQIGAAAGSGNNFAVQYHFGDLAGLVRAILTQRMAQTDGAQARALEALEAAGARADLRALLDVFLRPLLDPVDAQGERVYARFIVALLNSAEGMGHLRGLLHLAPTAQRIHERLRAITPHLPPGRLEERLRLVAILVLSSPFNRLAPAADPAGDAALIDDALDAAAGALAA